MADARDLLRAHRAENRIKHPDAAYSDAGKLICKICHKIVKTEALWNSHINSPEHQREIQVLERQPGSAYYIDKDKEKKSGTDSSKRKHLDLSDTDDDDGEYDMPRKRGKLDTSGSESAGSGSGSKRASPPTHNRGASNTPLHGVEIAIPSRPATPAAGSNSATSTPKGVPVGRSPLIGTETASTTATAQQNAPISTQALSVPSTTTAATASTAQAAPDAVDATEWAAFEAEIAQASEPTAAPTSALAAISSSATISAPALSAAQLAAKSEEEEHERRKHLLDAQIDDEREDAKLAFAAEMEEMEELEGRVRRLKERREELRKGSLANLRGAASATSSNSDADSVMAKGQTAEDKENKSDTIYEEDEDSSDVEFEEDEDNFWGFL